MKENLIPYEVKNGLCVTPCPHKNVMVGSGSCVFCKHFLRKDMIRKIVYCKNVLGNKK